MMKDYLKYIDVRFHYKSIDCCQTKSQSFSLMNWHLEDMTKTSTIVHYFSEIFDVNLLSTTFSADKPEPQVERLYKFYEKNCSSKDFHNALAKKGILEKEIGEIVAGKFIVPLVGPCLASDLKPNSIPGVEHSKLGLGTNFTWHGHLDMVAVPYYMEEAAPAPASGKAPTAMQAEATSGPQDVAAETDETALTAVAVSTVQEEEEDRGGSWL